MRLLFERGVYIYIYIHTHILLLLLLILLLSYLWIGTMNQLILVSSWILRNDIRIIKKICKKY